MMTDNLKVEHGGLDMAAGDLATSANNIQSRLDQLESDIKGKVAPNWTGDANEAFVRAKAQWDQGMNELRALLNTISTSVGNANQEYRATDARGAGRF